MKEKLQEENASFSPSVQIARSKASNQISEDIPQTRAALETPAAALRIACDLALRLSYPSVRPSCALQDDEAQSYALALSLFTVLHYRLLQLRVQILDFTLC